MRPLQGLITNLLKVPQVFSIFQNIFLCHLSLPPQGNISLSSAQMLIQMWYQHLRLFLQPLVWTHTGLKPHINNGETVCLVSPLIVWISCWAITQPRVFCRSKSRNSRLPSQPRNARGNDFLSPLIKSYL